MKNTKRVAFLLVAVMMLTSIFAIYSSAKTVTITQADDAKPGVAPVYLVYEDENKVEHPLKGGTAFFIDPKYAITAYHVGQLSESEASDIASLGSNSLGFSADFFLQNYKSRTYCKIYVSRDITVNATATEAVSKDNDYVVMKIESNLNEEMITVLPLASNSNLKTTSIIASYGFPDLASSMNERTFNTSEDVMVNSGAVTKLDVINGIDYIVHNCRCGNGMSGGPIISYDQKGVVGLVTGAIINDVTSYDYAVGIDEVKKTCDLFSIPYTEPNPSDHEHEWGEPAFDNSDCCTYKTCSICGEKQLVSGPDHTEPDASIESNWVVTREATKDEEGEKVLKCQVCGEVIKTESIEKLKDNTMLFIIIAIVALVVVIAIIVLLVLKGKKKNNNNEPVPTNRGPAGNTGFNPPQPPQPPVTSTNRPPVPPAPPVFNDDSGATTVLDDGIGETSVLNTGAGETSVLATPPTGHLIRIKTGEKIDISGTEFVIGKERRKVNYCITGNNSISRSHAKVISRAGSHYVVDMNSTNFTFVNGSKLVPGQEKEIKDGDKIKLADEEFEFKAD